MARLLRGRAFFFRSYDSCLKTVSCGEVETIVSFTHPSISELERSKEGLEREDGPESVV